MPYTLRELMALLIAARQFKKKDGQYHLAHLDELLQVREQGKLKDYVRATAKSCKNKN